jgi:hypothetical protein
MQSEIFDRFWENWNDEKKLFAIHVLCENIASNDTKAELRQNHVMWLQSRDMIKMIVYWAK